MTYFVVQLDQASQDLLQTKHPVMSSNTNRRQPISLANLKRKRDQQQSSEARPVFLTKQQREKLNRPSASTSTAPPKRPRLTPQTRTANDSDSNDDQVRIPRRPTAPEKGRSETLNARERDEIRRHYMRDQPTTYVSSSRSRVSGADRSRFRFNWDHKDDTTLKDDDELRQLREDAARSLAAGATSSRRTASQPSTLSLQRPRNSRLDKRPDDYDPRHWSEKKRSEMTPRDWRIFREDFLITTRSSGSSPAPLPARDWSEMGLPNQLIRLVCDVARYDRPSPIQMAAIPVGLARRDCIGLAETGSGKTAAFVLPLLARIMELPRMTSHIAIGGPYALVLAPTRELALQIEAEASKFARPMGYRVVHIIGGQVLDVQASELEAGCEVVVCTPGRMVDLLSKQMAALGNCQLLILDEADRMIDMGFEPQVSEVLESMPLYSETDPKRRQTFMFSATMSPVIERLARTYLHEPVMMSVGETGKAADNVTQKVEYFTTENRRRERFVELLQSLEAPILVFVNTRGGCDMVHKYIESRAPNVKTVIMHSGKSQDQRETTLERFKSGRYKVLIATDVVGRGIDIKGVRHVINFELPKTIEAYTHRIGRTGRAGEKGTAWSLATEANIDLFGRLCALLQQSKAHIPKEIARAAENAGGGKGGKAITD